MNSGLRATLAAIAILAHAAVDAIRLVLGVLGRGLDVEGVLALGARVKGSRGGGGYRAAHAAPVAARVAVAGRIDCLLRDTGAEAVGVGRGGACVNRGWSILLGEDDRKL